MNDPVSRAAFVWYAAECDANPALPKARTMTPGDVLAIAVPRVMKVFEGEVRWSETSPGDKAIWKGRPRDIELFERREGRTRVIGHNDWLNIYDTIEMGPDDEPVRHPGMRGQRHHRSVRMFGNVNIGNGELTNMQVAGQLGHDTKFEVHQAYAVVNRPLRADDDIFLTMVVGCQPVHAGPLHLREWIHGIPVGMIIPVRQNFSCTVEAYREVKKTLEIVVHYEGITKRYEQ